MMSVTAKERSRWWRFASSRNGLLSVNRMQEAIIFLQPYIPFLEGDTDPQIL